VRAVKNNETMIRSEKMASSILNNDSRNFFKEAKKMRSGGKGKLPYTVDNVTGNDEISNVFAEKFKSIFNSVNYCSSEMDDLKAKIQTLSREKGCDIMKCLASF
jgi:hypothetical protein